MTTPDVPLRMELTFELPASPDQLWEAIATANGISAWFIPTEFDERVGGAVAFHMGEDTSRGEVTAWEPPHRVEYAEPGWAALAGHPDAEVTPLVSEFLIEAQAGGTCVLRVVSSAFGTGADWEQEFFTEMEKGWRPFFDNLRLYLVEFPGQRVTSMSVDTQIAGSVDDVWSTVRRAFGANAVGDAIHANGLDAKRRAHRHGSARDAAPRRISGARLPRRARLRHG